MYLSEKISTYDFFHSLIIDVYFEKKKKKDLVSVEFLKIVENRKIVYCLLYVFVRKFSHFIIYLVL